MFFRSLFLSSIFVVLFSTNALTQTVRPVYMDADTVSKASENMLFFRLQNVNYFQNNEYFGEIIPGYTLPGTDLTPLLVYYPTSNTKLEAGMQIKHLFGKENDAQSGSFLRLHWMIRDWFSMVFGTLYSNSAHKLPEPLMNPERSFHEMREEGLQFLFDHKYFEADAWVSWDDFIWFRDKKNEKVWGGLSAKLKLDIGENRFELPIYATAYHVGGQIDLTTNPAITDLNLGTGLRYKRELNGFLDKIEFSSEVFTYDNNEEQTYDYFRDRELFYQGVSLALNDNYYEIVPFVEEGEVEMIEPTAPAPPRNMFNKGYGALSRLVLYRGNWKTSFAYWKGFNFMSARGDYVYHNQSPFTYAILSERSLGHWNGTYEHKISKGLKFAVALDAYYLIEEATTDFGMGAYLFFDRDFFISKLKRR